MPITSGIGLTVLSASTTLPRYALKISAMGSDARTAVSIAFLTVAMRVARSALTRPAVSYMSLAV